LGQVAVAAGLYGRRVHPNLHLVGRNLFAAPANWEEKRTIFLASPQKRARLCGGRTEESTRNGSRELFKNNDWVCVMSVNVFLDKSSTIEVVEALVARKVFPLLAEQIMGGFEGIFGETAEVVDITRDIFLTSDKLCELQIAIFRIEDGKREWMLNLTARLVPSALDTWGLEEKPVVFGRWKPDKWGLISLLPPDHPLYLRRAAELKAAEIASATKKSAGSGAGDIGLSGRQRPKP
jgi:hypothetical protein